MRIKSVGKIIAERKLDGEFNGRKCKVTVAFGKPRYEKTTEGSCWYCPYRIKSPRGARLFYGAGLDSLQALIIAISMAGAELANQYSEMELRGTDDDGLGFSPSALT